MEHRLRRIWFENTIFCIAVVKLACTVHGLKKKTPNLRVPGPKATKILIFLPVRN